MFMIHNTDSNIKIRVGRDTEYTYIVLFGLNNINFCKICWGGREGGGREGGREYISSLHCCPPLLRGCQQVGEEADTQCSVNWSDLTIHLCFKQAQPKMWYPPNLPTLRLST